MKHPAQEPNVVPARLITVVLGSVIATIVISLVIMWAIQRWRTGELHGQASAPAEQMRGVPSEVNAMETMPFSEAERGVTDNATAEGILTSYGWIDRAHGIISVPIDVAFDLYLARQQGAGVEASARRAP